MTVKDMHLMNSEFSFIDDNVNRISYWYSAQRRLNAEATTNFENSRTRCYD